MSSCTLSKSKDYKVENISFNPINKKYQLTLVDKPAGCESGIFSSKKLELKTVTENKIPVLHFNKQTNTPILILNNLSLVKYQNTSTTETTSTEPIQNSVPTQNSLPHFSFLYIILGVVVIFMLIKFLSKKREQQPPYNAGNNNPNNLLNGNNNPNINAPYNGPTAPQGPSRTGSFLTGLAGGALGAVVGNELYDKFKGHDANAAQNPNLTNSNDTYSSDDNDDDNYSGGDDNSDSYSSDD